ncbi:SMP-30/gluconolactonase/LRE family protein [Pararhizobium mangrovi]|uniref:SMP-30/gluconolactonase/LRE family protein n=1 Tax=Pararhizobium mangrovi TaxID=2590452 RepID=A0A506U0X9_9HYPH|nr:SMP-30/gluconolactonase/LRE family protein [Pararhizobium mangrovi]TPW26605.1 SMP-30/gluconolactonase/LRE family protein [Pararhizobium mangrovi]
MTSAPQDFAGRDIGGTAYELAEGAIYEPDGDTAWWLDILDRTLVEYRIGEDRLTTHALPMMASALARIDGERHVIVSEDGLCVRQKKSGTMSRYMEIESDTDATRSNDSRVHPCGALWTSTMGKHAEDGAGSIYHVFEGKLTRLFTRISIPNAICFSADGATGYFTDTRIGDIMRVDLDPQTGRPTGEPQVFAPHDSAPGNADGAVVDAHGNLWNARFGAGIVAVYAPDGSLSRTVDIPAGQATCPAFVGADADRLIVTSAFEGMDESARSKDPLAGHVFMPDISVEGRLDPIMRL